jgi:Protein of unknown function (DUF4031)
MAVYVDDAIWHWAGRRWCHLMADDLAELHGFAAKLGLHRSSYQGPPKTAAPHYDITAFERDRAVRLGAVACSRHEIVAVCRRVRVRDGKSLSQVASPFAAVVNHPEKLLNGVQI